MGKYASWNEFEKNVPTTYKEKATPDAYRTGMNGIAPTGLKVKDGRVKHYGDGVDGKGEVMVSSYKRAMFEQTYQLGASPDLNIEQSTAVAAAVEN